MPQANQYWRHPFRPVMGSRQLVEFVVLDAEPAGQASGRFALADVQAGALLPVCCFCMPKRHVLPACCVLAAHGACKK
jgi:hypothetical protein